MVSQSEQLTPKQERFIAALLAGQTIVAAAASVGIAEKTAHAWLHLEHVTEAYRQAKNRLFDETLDELRAGMSDAIKALRKHLDAEIVQPTAATHFAAIKLWIEQGIDLHKTAELEEKMSELERLVKQVLEK